jgi:hypothetical protein
MDIDDLLAEVAGDATPLESRDLQELTRAWVAERTAPEILGWPEELMERVLERIRRQVCWRAFFFLQLSVRGRRRRRRVASECRIGLDWG